MAERNRLEILLGLKDQTAAGLKSATSNLNKFSSRLKAVAAPAAVLGAAIGGAVFQFARLGDEVEKMSRRTGFTVESLSELQFAAQQSGTSLQGLELGIRRMQKNLLDAERGLSTAVDGFDRLNLSVEDLIKLSPEEQFEKILAALADLPNEYEKVALAQELFGRAGTQLIPLMDAGAEGIAKLRQEARDLGIVFDKETAAKAARMVDAMNSAKQSLNALAIDIGSTVEPAVSLLARGFSELPAPLRAGAAAAAIFFTAFRLGILSLRTALISTGVGAFIIALAILAERMGIFGDETGEAGAQLSLIELSIKRLVQQAELAGKPISEVEALFAKTVETLKLQRAGLSQVTIELENHNVVNAKTSDILDELDVSLAAAGASMDDVREATKDLGISEVELITIFDDVVLATARAARAQIGLANDMVTLTSTALAAKLALKLFRLEQAGLPAGAAIFSESIMAEVRALQALQAQEQRIALLTQTLIGPSQAFSSSLEDVGGNVGGLNSGLADADELLSNLFDTGAIAFWADLGNQILAAERAQASFNSTGRGTARTIETITQAEFSLRREQELRLKNLAANTGARALAAASRGEPGLTREQAAAFGDPSSLNRGAEFIGGALARNEIVGGSFVRELRTRNNYGDTIINVRTTEDAAEALETLT